MPISAAKDLSISFFRGKFCFQASAQFHRVTLRRRLLAGALAARRFACWFCASFKPFFGLERLLFNR
jgi:hypothetical protein